MALLTIVFVNYCWTNKFYERSNHNGIIPCWKVKELSRYQVELNEAHALAKNGLLSLLITVGLKVLNTMMAEEVEVKAGKKGRYNKDRNLYRHGTEQSSVTLGGQKTKIEKPRLRSKDNQEVPLEILNHFQSEDALDFTVLKYILAGVSTRDYEGLQDVSSDTFGAKKSTISRRFIKESSKTMKEFLNRRIDDDSYPVTLVPTKVIFDFICDYVDGSPTTSNETSNVIWVPKNNVLKYITHPLALFKTKNVVEFDGRVHHCSFVTKPEFKVLSSRFV